MEFMQEAYTGKVKEAGDGASEEALLEVGTWFTALLRSLRVNIERGMARHSEGVYNGDALCGVSAYLLYNPIPAIVRHSRPARGLPPPHRVCS